MSVCSVIIRRVCEEEYILSHIRRIFQCFFYYFDCQRSVLMYKLRHRWAFSIMVKRSREQSKSLFTLWGPYSCIILNAWEWKLSHFSPEYKIIFFSSIHNSSYIRNVFSSLVDVRRDRNFLWCRFSHRSLCWCVYGVWCDVTNL